MIDSLTCFIAFMAALCVFVFVGGVLFGWWTKSLVSEAKHFTNYGKKGYVAKWGKYVHLESSCEWLKPAKHELRELAICPRCVESLQKQV